MHAHFVALALLLAAVLWPEWFTYPAGLALLAANAWLLRNLLAAVTFYRRQRLKIEETLTHASAAAAAAR
jgi:O-antigen/teichoic acid export membrane protein